MGDGDSGNTSISGLMLQAGRQPEEELHGLPIFGFEFFKVLADEEEPLPPDSDIVIEFLVGSIRAVFSVLEMLVKFVGLLVIIFGVRRRILNVSFRLLSSSSMKIYLIAGNGESYLVDTVENGVEGTQPPV